MALRSAVAPLLIVLLASPARAATAAPTSAPSTPARSPGTTSAPTTSGPATSAPTTSGPLTAPVTTGRESTGPVAVPAAPGSERDPEASAEALYNAGEQAYWLGDFRRAVDLFEAAYARSGLPALLYNVGLATMRRYELTQDPEDLRRARAVLTNYAQELTRDPSLQQADNVPRLIAQLDATLAGLTAPGPSPAPRPAAITPATAPAEPRCEPAPPPVRTTLASRRAGAAVMTVGGLALAGGVATTLAFALKGQSFQHQQEALLADAAGRGCGDTPTSAACLALEQARSITVHNGQRANLLAGSLGGGLTALGLAGLVVGAVLYARAPRTPGKLALTPALTPRSAGLFLAGRF